MRKLVVETASSEGGDNRMRDIAGQVLNTKINMTGNTEQTLEALDAGALLGIAFKRLTGELKRARF